MHCCRHGLIIRNNLEDKFNANGILHYKVGREGEGEREREGEGGERERGEREEVGSREGGEREGGSRLGIGDSDGFILIS